MPIYLAFNVCLENQEFFRELVGEWVGTYVQEDNSVLVKSGTMGIGWGTLFPYMGHVMLSINEITWTGTLYTIAYNHWVRTFSFPGSTPVCGVFFPGRKWVII